MPKTLAILQPGKIGDLIICQPIAQHYIDQGWRVVWPIDQQYLSMFKSAFPQIEWQGTSSPTYSWLRVMAGNAKPDKVLDLYFGFADAPAQNHRRWLESGLSFDQYKYQLAGLPIETKYTLRPKRDLAREQMLSTDLGLRSDSEYVVQHCSASDSSVTLPKHLLDTVKITNRTDNVFDWLGVLEQASAFMMIDSCFVNLCAGMAFKQPGLRYWRPGYRREIDYPVLPGNWQTVKGI